MKWFVYFKGLGTFRWFWIDDRPDLGSLINLSSKSLRDETVKRLQSPAGPHINSQGFNEDGTDLTEHHSHTHPGSGEACSLI